MPATAQEKRHWQNFALGRASGNQENMSCSQLEPEKCISLLWSRIFVDVAGFSDGSFSFHDIVSNIGNWHFSRETRTCVGKSSIVFFSIMLYL